MNRSTAQKILARFARRYAEKFGSSSPARAEFPRFGQQAKVLIETWGEPALLALVDSFFTSDDPRVTRSAYRPSDFLRVAQALMLSRYGHVRPDIRTAERVDAGVRAMQPLRAGRVG